MNARGFAQIGAVAYGAALALALVTVLLRSPQPVTPALETNPGCSPGDFAHYCRGVRARVSSYDVFGNHHPLFAIDGRRSPELREKWVPGRRDSAPWIELWFPMRTDFSVVRLTMAGHSETPNRTMGSYRLSCSAGGELRAELDVRDNRAATPTHAIECSGVDTLRIEFEVEPGTRRDLVRLVEIEAVP